MIYKPTVREDCGDGGGLNQLNSSRASVSAALVIDASVMDFRFESFGIKAFR